MLYLDKLTMLAVLGFALGLAWASVPPTDLQARAIQINPIAWSGKNEQTFELKVTDNYQAACSYGCSSDGMSDKLVEYAVDHHANLVRN
ncbi:hypothetical protein LPB41_00700 [Thalassospira sp. MA62]|nr:hypothetical protein [Thalassospira sp. MA62]